MGTPRARAPRKTSNSESPLNLQGPQARRDRGPGERRVGQRGRGGHIRICSRGRGGAGRGRESGAEGPGRRRPRTARSASAARRTLRARSAHTW